MSEQTAAIEWYANSTTAPTYPLITAQQGTLQTIDLSKIHFTTDSAPAGAQVIYLERLSLDGGSWIFTDAWVIRPGTTGETEFTGDYTGENAGEDVQFQNPYFGAGAGQPILRLRALDTNSVELRGVLTYAGS